MTYKEMMYIIWTVRTVLLFNQGVKVKNSKRVYIITTNMALPECLGQIDILRSGIANKSEINHP